MPWLPYTGEGGLISWGQPFRFEAAPIGPLAAAIMENRRWQQQQLQQGLGSLSKAIMQARQDQVADALTKQYEDAGLIPQGMINRDRGPFSGPGTGAGMAGLGAAQDWMTAQKFRTYPTDLGTDPNTGQPITMPLTRDQQFRALQERARLQ